MKQPTRTATPRAKPRAYALYEADVEAIERIRAHFELDSASQALRRAVRIAIRSIDENGANPRSAA